MLKEKINSIPLNIGFILFFLIFLFFIPIIISVLEESEIGGVVGRIKTRPGFTYSFNQVRSAPIGALEVLLPCLFDRPIDIPTDQPTDGYWGS